MASNQWVVVVGNFAPGQFGGFRVAGPFRTADEAGTWIEADVPTHEGLLAEMLELEEPSSIIWP